MTGPCMCGDPYCFSCGPAQGFDPREQEASEALYEIIENEVLACPACSEVIDPDELATWLAGLMVEHPGKFKAILEAIETGGE